jgi:bacterioferritin-associated ferredoxin
MNSLFACIQWSDNEDNDDVPSDSFMSNISVSKLHEDFIESGGMLQLTTDEVEALILDFHTTKNLAASLAISAKCGDCRPATASLFELCRSSITDFEKLGNEDKCSLLLRLLRIHRDVPEIVLLSLGSILCLVQSEMNMFRLLDNKICDDLAWIMSNYKWAYVGSVTSDTPSKNTRERESFLRKRNLQLRVIGWCVRLVWFIAENEVEGRNALETTVIGDDIYAFLYQLLECLKQGGDSQLVSCDGAMGHHYDLFTLFLTSRPTSAASTTTTAAIPDYCNTLSDSLRRPVNFFVVASCGAICHLCRENITTSVHLSSLGLKELLESASLATRQTMYPGASEESFGALLMVKKVLLWTMEGNDGIRQDIMSKGVPDEAAIFRRPVKYQLSKDLVVQVNNHTLVSLVSY